MRKTVPMLADCFVGTLNSCGTTPTDWGESVREVLDSTEPDPASSGDKEVYKGKEDVRSTGTSVPKT